VESTEPDSCGKRRAGAYYLGFFAIRHYPRPGAVGLVSWYGLSKVRSALECPLHLFMDFPETPVIIQAGVTAIRTNMSDSNKGKKRQFVSLPSQDDLTVVEHPNVHDSSSNPRIDDHHGTDTDAASSGSKPGRTSPDPNPLVEHGRLHRALSARQVQMIAIAGE